MSVFKGVLSNGFTVGRRGALIGRKGSRKATTKIRHTLFGSIYSSPWEALSVMSHTGSCAWCIYGVGLGGGGSVLFHGSNPLNPQLSHCHAPGNKVYHMSRTAGLHGRSNCHLLSCALCTVSTEIKSKKHLLCIPALYLAGKTVHSSGTGSPRPPLCSVIPAARKGV